jgi:type II secretory ATPase GspE/PulE/Tfp pilus assembly ATPase PilB-like protein
MALSTDTLKELLVEQHLIEEASFDNAVQEAEVSDEDLSTVLVERGLITDDQLGALIAEHCNVRLLDLNHVSLDEGVFSLIPEVVARTQGVIAVYRDEAGVVTGMRDPGNLEARHIIEKRIGEKIVPAYVTAKTFNMLLARYHGKLTERFSGLLERTQSDTVSQAEHDALNIEAVDQLLLYGYESKASDVHIEPLKDKVVVRFRIDGMMHQVLSFPKSFYEGIIARIKIMARMRTDEHRTAQDGKLQFLAGDENVDVRVSIVPVADGENIVMRLLSARSRQFNISTLGFSEKDRAIVERAMKKPHGMILVTGPTGSGKTTTIYSILKVLNTETVNIATIEDPVEYDIEGITQIQVNARAELTFAKGLRAIVRQDPDIVLVGEVRDSETASIAINSAMTGHLVLSTIHANDAATTLPRLLDMGIEPFLVASTVNVIVAQRLVRILCTNCRYSAIASKEEMSLIAREKELKDTFADYKYHSKHKPLLFKAKGCDVCGGTGYRGRAGIFEVLEITEPVRELIMSRSSSDEIAELAQKEGMTMMLADGVSKVLLGVTTLEEVLRVTKV